MKFWDLLTSRVSKYVLSGLIATLVMFGSLFFFGEILEIWYLYSSTLAFILAFITSFLLQKLWTFKNHRQTNTHQQLVLFFVVSIVNLGINGLGMFILVDKLNVWYFLSQFFVSSFIAVWSFFAYQAIFKEKQEFKENQEFKEK